MKSNIRRKIIFVLTILLLIFTLCTYDTVNFGSDAAGTRTQAIYYVSPSGSDKNPGTLAKPFATIQKAREAVRTKNTKMTGDIYVFLMDGTYHIDKTITFDERDSATNGYKIYYKAMAGKTPVLSGGVQIKGWTRVDGTSQWKAKVTSVDNFRQLYVDGNRASRTRSKPLKGIGYHYGPVAQDGIIVKDSEIGYYANPSDTEIVRTTNNNWTFHIIAVRDIKPDSAGKKAIIGEPASFLNHLQFNPNSPAETVTRFKYDQQFYIENAYELMDSPGEWYLDRVTDTLYYWPKAGEDMTKTGVFVPKLDKLIDVQGSSLSKRVKGLVFDGITFAHTTELRACDAGSFSLQSSKWATMMGQSAMDSGSAGYQPKSAVEIDLADNIAFRNCVFKRFGGMGLAAISGVKDIEITRNTFTDISDAAIIISRWTYIYDDKSGIVPYNILIKNNTIDSVGVEYKAASAIKSYYTDTLKVEHNLIANCPYSGISVGWGHEQNNSNKPNRNYSIRYNRIYNVMQFCFDGGGIYNSGNSPGTYIEENYISNLNYLGNVGGALQFDAGSANIHVNRNVIENITKDGKDHQYVQFSHKSCTSIFVDSTYTNSQKVWRVDRGKCKITNTHYYVNLNERPAEAIAIINNSGPEK